MTIGQGQLEVKLTNYLSLALPRFFKDLDLAYN